MEEFKEKLYEYLDWYSFVNYAEVMWAVWEFYEKYFAQNNSSWWDLSYYWQLADEYCIDREILWFDDVQELLDKIEELENFDYSYNEADNYMEACELCDVDPRENSDFTDEELIIEDVKRRAEEWDLQWIKNVLEDIDIGENYFMYDWYWRPRNIDRSDVDYVIDEKLKELRWELENTLDILHSWE